MATFCYYGFYKKFIGLEVFKENGYLYFLLNFVEEPQVFKNSFEK